MSQEKLINIVETFRQISGDQNLKILETEDGIIILKLESYEDAFKVIQSLYESGKLTEILGLPVEYVGYEYQSSLATKTVNVFCSYAAEDELFMTQLTKHLKFLERQEVISVWCKSKILAGSETNQEILQRLNSANLILLLISSDFLASDFCWGVEIQRAMERHKAGEANVIPVILRPVDDWQSSKFGKLQPLPQDGKPITSWLDLDTAFANIFREIRLVTKQLK